MMCMVKRKGERRSSAERGIKQPIENVMQMIVRRNPDLIKGLVLSGQKWFEIDDQHDLDAAERFFS